MINNNQIKYAFLFILFISFGFIVYNVAAQESGSDVYTQTAIEGLGGSTPTPIVVPTVSKNFVYDYLYVVTFEGKKYVLKDLIFSSQNSSCLDLSDKLICGSYLIEKERYAKTTR